MLLIANSTFVNKISHSSQSLRVDNIKGSFLGSNILRKYDTIENGLDIVLENTPANFEALFSIHQKSTWDDNLALLVEATHNIEPAGVRYTPTEAEVEKILASVDLAQSLLLDPDYLAIKTELDKTVSDNEALILEAAAIDNVNERGNKIEQIITQVGNFHGLDDLKFKLIIGYEVLVDVKTKLKNLSSSPKGYNVDKVLKQLAKGNIIICYYFIGIDIEQKKLTTRLVPIVDQKIIEYTRIQPHWAGRNSRGVSQLTSDYAFIFSGNFSTNINSNLAKEFLQSLINLKQPEDI